MLKPQQGWTYETGLKSMDGNSSWKIAVFNMDIKDKFYWDKDPVTNADILINKGDFRNTGVEVEYRKIKLGSSIQLDISCQAHLLTRPWH